MRDRSSSCGVVTGNHHYANTGGTALGDRGRYLFAQWVRQSHEADELKVEFVFYHRPCRSFELTSGHSENSQAVVGERIYRSSDTRLRRSVQMAQFNYSLRCTLGCHDLHSAFRGRPDMRHRTQRRAERVGLHQLPVTVDVLGFAEEPLSKLVERLFHRIERVDYASQNGIFDQPVKRLR